MHRQGNKLKLNSLERQRPQCFLQPNLYLLQPNLFSGAQPYLYLFTNFSAAQANLYLFSEAQPNLYLFSAAQPYLYLFSVAQPSLYLFSAAQPSLYLFSAAQPYLYLFSAAKPNLCLFNAAQPNIYLYSAAQPSPSHLLALTILALLFFLSPVQHKAESNLAPHCETLLPTPRHLSAFHSHQGHPHLQDATGFGKTTPAVYTAWNSPCWCTRLVISLIKTGATRFERSFLCTHRKLISTIFFVLKKHTQKHNTCVYIPLYVQTCNSVCICFSHLCTIVFCVQLYFMCMCQCVV